LNDEDRKNLALLLSLVQGLKIDAAGMRQHVSSAQDLHDSVLRDVLRVLIDIRDRERRKGHTWPGDSV
jgi:hypothetical protein